MKMQRRSFLKTVGATLAGTLGLGATKSLPKAVEPKFATGGLVGLDRLPVFLCGDKPIGEAIRPHIYVTSVKHHAAAKALLRKYYKD